jgi:alpha-L-fucosidase
LDEQRAVVNDLERNMTEDLLRIHWQKDLCIGAWHYDVNRYRTGYHTTREMVNLLVDVVSKNGTFLLNIPLPGSGEIDDKAIAFLDGMTQWMAANSECIYDTRPWTVYGEGPSVKNDAKVKDTTTPPRGIGPNHTANDIRFTTKGDTLYAIALGTPQDGKIAIKSLAANSPLYTGEIGAIEQLGAGGRVPFTRDQSGVTVTIAPPPVGDLAVALKVSRKQ